MKKIGEVFPLVLIDRMIDKINIKDVKKSLVEIGELQREIGQSWVLYRIHLRHPVLDCFAVVEIEYSEFDNGIQSPSICFIAENIGLLSGVGSDMRNEFLGLLIDIYPDLLTLDNLDSNLIKGMATKVSECFIYTGYSNGNLIFRINQYKQNLNI